MLIVLIGCLWMVVWRRMSIRSRRRQNNPQQPPSSPPAPPPQEVQAAASSSAAQSDPFSGANSSPPGQASGSAADSSSGNGQPPPAVQGGSESSTHNPGHAGVQKSPSPKKVSLCISLAAKEASGSRSQLSTEVADAAKEKVTSDEGRDAHQGRVLSQIVPRCRHLGPCCVPSSCLAAA